MTINTFKPVSEEELKNLPEELINELAVSIKYKQKESIILEIIKEQGGVVDINRLLVEIYKKTNKVVKRKKIIINLSNMVKKGFLYKKPKKQGFYFSSPF